jgi:hypothetical protein
LLTSTFSPSVSNEHSHSCENKVLSSQYLKRSQQC